MIKPNTAYVIPFSTTAAGIATAADSTPTAVLWRNGSAEVTSVVIVTTANTGIYHASFTTDSGWAATDRIWLVVSATIDGDGYTGIAWDSFGESDSKDVIAEAVAQYDQRDEDSTAGTIGWYFKKLRQASNTVEAVVTNDITPTATTFSVALTTYPTGAFTHAVLAVVEDGAILDQNSPILTYTNNTTYSTIVLEEAFTQAPAVGNVMLINVISHVHSVASIAAGVWGATSAAYSAATGTFGYLANAISTMIEYVGGFWRFGQEAVANVNVAVLPAVGISADRSPGVVLSPFVGETISQSITLYQTDGTTPIVLTGKTLEIVFETRQGTDVAVIANASIVVSGASDNVVTFSYPAAVTLAQRVLRFALRDDAAPHTVYLTGLCKVAIAPGSDPA